MPSSYKSPIRLSPGDKALSSSTWNGFVELYEDKYQRTSISGDPLNRPVPPILQNSNIVLAQLPQTMINEGVSIGGYQPVRIWQVANQRGAAMSLPVYEVQPVKFGRVNDLGYGGQNTGEAGGWYGFTMAEGIGKLGGRIVIGGLAIAAIDGDWFIDSATMYSDSRLGRNQQGYYVVDDQTLTPESPISRVQPAGHFKIVAPIDATAAGGLEFAPNASNNKYVVIDMERHASNFYVYLPEDADPATDEDTPDWASDAAAIRRTGGSLAYSSYLFTGSTVDQNGTLPDDADHPEQYAVQQENRCIVYNLSEGIIPSGWRLATYSSTYNRFIFVNSGGGSTTFQVELEQTGGEQGTSAEPTSWTYNVRKWEGDGSIIKADAEIVGLPNHYRRPNVGQLSTATFGTATYNSAGDLVIIDCNETLIFTTC